jgi:hypothetical protein
MRSYKKQASALCAAMVVVAFAAMSLAGSASAHTGEWAKFNYCPSTTTGVNKCLYAVTNGGKVVLGKKTVPIVNPVTLQGGYSRPAEEGPEEGLSKFYGATNGITLSATPQPVPGGLTGLVNCKEISNIIERILCESTFENGLTGVNATLELAKPASEIRVGELNLAFEEGVALKLPVRVHLENPLLGSGCYIGSSSAPLMWNLTTGSTTPPAGTAPIHGSGGLLKLIEESQIAEITGAELVDNAWSAPSANGCGGFLVEYILDPIINASVGVPSAAGKNVAVLQDKIYFARAEAVNKH